MLVKLYHACTDGSRQEQYASIASTLFFQLGETITDSVLEFPPTQQVIASCIDILGKVGRIVAFSCKVLSVHS